MDVQCQDGGWDHGSSQIFGFETIYSTSPRRLVMRAIFLCMREFSFAATLLLVPAVGATVLVRHSHDQKAGVSTKEAQPGDVELCRWSGPLASALDRKEERPSAPGSIYVSEQEADGGDSEFWRHP